MTSRAFNQDTSAAKRAAGRGPVYITDRGRPAHVLLTYEAYEQLIGARRVLDALAEPPGVEGVELDLHSEPGEPGETPPPTPSR